MIKRLLFTVIILFSVSESHSTDFYTQMNSLYDSRQFDKLESVCKEKIKENEKSIDAYYYLVAIHLYNGNFEEAIPYMEKFQ